VNKVNGIGCQEAELSANQKTHNQSLSNKQKMVALKEKLAEAPRRMRIKGNSKSSRLSSSPGSTILPVCK